jgi:aryl-alcohol dehydrogenase-like predicted oxidoreductase
VAGSLDTYRLLGRSGLRVSPLGLGTMTFGTDWGWGAEKDEARRIFDTYVDRGGNFLDTANQYTNGTAEELLGEFARQRRDSLVLATKYTLTTRPGDPN